MPGLSEELRASILARAEGIPLMGNADRKADELLSVVERLPPGVRTQFLNAHIARFRGHLAARSGNAEEADRVFKRAGGLFHELAVPFHLAVTRLENAEWLAGEQRTEEARPLLAEAREIFERLEAKPWLERLGRTASVGRETEAVTAGS